MIEDEEESNVIELKKYFTKRYGPGDWVHDEIADGATFEEILEQFDLTPGEVFEFLLNAGMIDQDRLQMLLEIN